MPTQNFRTLFRFAVIAALLCLAAIPVAAHNGADSAFAAPQPPATDTPLVAVTGTVNELVVDNLVSGANTRYLSLRLDDGSSVALAGLGLDALLNGQRVEVTGRTSGQTLFITSTSTLPATPKAKNAKALISTVVQGTLAVVHEDYFDQGRGTYRIVVRSGDNQATVLGLAVVPDVLQIGMSVVVQGTPAADGTSLDVSSITIVAPAVSTGTNVPAAPITNRVLVMLIQFTDSPAPAFTPAQVDQVMRTDPGSVANYYQEVSYGNQFLNITVTSTWLQAGVATPACDYMTIAADADAAATAAGYVPTNYDNRYYVMPPNSACGWAGLAYIGYGQAWSNGYNALSVYGHELGHNFGLYHSGNLTCPGQSIGPNCVGNYTSNEYGDPFDVMGNIYPGHFNSMQKSGLGWIPASSVKTHTSGSATYTLSPLEASGQSTYAVKIPAASNRTYWIEYRQPIGVDSGIASSNGAQIRVASPLEFPCTGSCGGDDTQILDMTLGTPGNFNDAALLLNQTYTDSQYGINVTVTGVATGPTGSLTLSVSMGGKTPTTTTLASSANPSLVGASVTFTATVAGTAPTGTVAFTDGGSTITGCGAMALPAGAANSKIATCSTSSMSAGTHSIVATYSGDAGNNGSTSATLSQVVNSKVPTSTSLSSSANPSLIGASVTFTATVAGTAPTGTVAFTDGGSTITGCGAMALPAGAANSKIATCGTSNLSAGTHSIVATYSGDAGNNGSTSATLSQVVNSKVPSSTSLSSSANPANAGATVTLTATVTAAVPTGNVAFTEAGTALAGCSAVPVSGTSAVCNTSSLSFGTHSIVATYGGNASTAGSASAALLQTINPAGEINVALASNGGIASASSTYTQSGYSFAAAAINNNERAGVNWGNGGGWIDATVNAYPDWVEIDFNGSKTIDHVIVYTVQDNYTSPVEPTDSMTFSLYGITDFTVQGWNGAAWVTLGTVSGNQLVKRTVNFTATTTDRIRINVTNALSSYSRITEVEAWGN